MLGLEVLAFGSARAAIAAVLTVARPSTSTVVTPAYTCVAVPNAVKTAGCRTRWVDISGPNLDLDATAAIVHDGDAVIVQHTYGVGLNLAKLECIREQGAMLIEDRAHRFDANDIVGDFAIFSLEHSKVVSGGQGGLVWAADGYALAELRRLRERLPVVSDREARRILRTSAVQAGLARMIGTSHVLSSFVRRAALRVGPVSTPAQSVEELEGRRVRLTRLHPALASVATRSVRNAASNLEHRRAIAAIYRQELGSLVPEWARVDIPFVRQPVVVADADGSTDALRGAGLDLGVRWFNAPVHPLGANSDYAAGSAPNAENLAVRILSLPTHPMITPDTARLVAAAVRSVSSAERPIR